MVLPFVDRHEVEEHREKDHDQNDQDHELQQRREISLNLLVVHQVRDVRTKRLHERNVPEIKLIGSEGMTSPTRSYSVASVI